jgi:hypothetical protein
MFVVSVFQEVRPTSAVIAGFGNIVRAAKIKDVANIGRAPKEPESLTVLGIAESCESQIRIKNTAQFFIDALNRS